MTNCGEVIDIKKIYNRTSIKPLMKTYFRRYPRNNRHPHTIIFYEAIVSYDIIGTQQRDSALLYLIVRDVLYIIFFFLIDKIKDIHKQFPIYHMI